MEGNSMGVGLLWSGPKDKSVEEGGPPGTEKGTETEIGTDGTETGNTKERGIGEEGDAGTKGTEP